MPETLAREDVVGPAQPSSEAPKPVEAPKPAAENKTISRGGVKIDRADIVHGTTTGESVTLKSFPEDRTRDKKEQEIVIKSETVDKYNKVLRTFVKNMSRMAEQEPPAGSTEPTLYDHLLKDPARKADKLILDKLSKAVLDENGKPIGRTVNEDALREFLTSGNASNWAIATGILEQEALWGELAGGLQAVIKEPIYNRRGEISTDGEVAAIIDKTPTVRNIGKTVASKAVVGALAGLYFVGGRGTTEFKTKSDLETLQKLKLIASDDDLAYLYARTGIDLNRVDINTSSSGELSIDLKDGYVPPVEANHERIVTALSARKEFLAQLNIDESSTRHLGMNIDRSVDIRFPEEFIFNDKQRAEGLSVQYSMDVMTEYNRIVGGATDKYVRLRAMAEAREVVMVRLLVKEGKLGERAKDKEDIKALKGKKDAMERRDPKLIAEQTGKLTEARKAAVEAKAAAEARKTELVDPLPAKSRAVEEIEAQMIREFRLPVGENFEGSVSMRVEKLQQDLENAEKALQTASENKARAIEGHADALTAKLSQQTTAIKELAAKLSGSKTASGAGGASVETSGGDTTINIPALDIDKLLERYTASEDIRHDGNIRRAEERYNTIKVQLEMLEDKQKEYQQAARDRETAVFTIAAREPGQLKAGQDAFDTFTNPTAVYIAPGWAAISEADLGTLSVDDLADMLIPAIKDPTERVKLAILAKAEAKGRQEKIPEYQIDALIDVTQAWTGINPDDLFRSVNELGESLRSTTTGITADEAREDILAARMAVEKMIQARFTARTNLEIEYYGQVIKDTDKKMEKLGDFSEQIEELDATITVLDSQEDIFGRGYQIVDEPDKVAALVDSAIVTAADTGYSAAELEAGEEKGYYEWVRFLRPDYINHETDRDKIFEAMHRILPPDKLAELLNTHLSLGTRSPRTLDRVLGRLSSRSLSGADMQLVSKQIMNYMRDRGLTL